MKVIGDFESRPHKAVTFKVERGKERQEWSEQRVPLVLPGYSGERLPRRNMEEKGGAEGEEAEGSAERRVRNEIIKKKAVDESAEHEGKKTGGPDLMRSSDCSQIENEEDEES